MPQWTALCFEQALPLLLLRRWGLRVLLSVFWTQTGLGADDSQKASMLLLFVGRLNQHGRYQTAQAVWPTLPGVTVLYRLGSPHSHVGSNRAGVCAVTMKAAI
jgi:hypothetical protein